MSRNIQLGDEKGLEFPSVWDWSLQFTAQDRTLFHNPSYVGKSAPRVQSGSAKAFKRAKVSGGRADGGRGPRFVTSRPGQSSATSGHVQLALLLRV